MVRFSLWEKINFGKNNDNEVEIIMAQISERLVVPEEIPTVATVTDKKLLADQVFFQKAEDGDKLLIFANANLAILYRPSIKKIVEISQISAVNSPQIKPVPTEEVVKEKIKVAIYNGNGEVGVATKFEREIIDKLDYFEVVKKTDAKNNYDKSQIINISDQFSEIATTLVESLDGELVEMPEGEVAPEADILIIVGKNWP